MMLKRVMGKASFATLQDQSGRIQIYVTRDEVGEDVYAAFKHWDLGDIVAAEGTVFKTRTGELSVHATSVRLLTKSLRPMPDKFHGIADQEVKYRQRYVDLMTDEPRASASSRAARRSAASATSWSSTTSSRSRRRCCIPSRAAPTHGRSSRTTTRWTRKCSCGSRRSCTEAAAGRRLRAGVRDQPQLPQRRASRCATTPSSP
jgi:hypothetical protein